MATSTCSTALGEAHAKVDTLDYDEAEASLVCVGAVAGGATMGGAYYGGNVVGGILPAIIAGVGAGIGAAIAAQGERSATPG